MYFVWLMAIVKNFNKIQTLCDISQFTLCEHWTCLDGVIFMPCIGQCKDLCKYISNSYTKNAAM